MGIRAVEEVEIEKKRKAFRLKNEKWKRGMQDIKQAK